MLLALVIFVLSGSFYGTRGACRTNSIVATTSSSSRTFFLYVVPPVVERRVDTIYGIVVYLLQEGIRGVLGSISER